MKNILYLFLFSLIACSPKEKTEEIQTLKDFIFYIDSDNSRMVQVIKKEALEGGSKPADQAIFEKAKEIIAKRNLLKEKESFLTDYLNLLTIEYKELEEAPDTTRIKRTSQLITSFKTTKDSAVYYNAFSSLLLIENAILNGLSLKIGNSCRFFNQYAATYKERDTISSGETYSLVLIPDLRCPNTIDVTIDSDIKLFHNGTRVDVPVTVEKIGGLVALKVSPKQTGNYKIAGELTLKSKTVDFKLANKYNDTFYVK